MMKPPVPTGADGRPQHPIKANYLKPVVDQFKAEGKPFKMGMVFPVSTHNYELRYWLAAGGINPGYYAPLDGDTSGTVAADALLSVTPPPQMPATLEAGTIYDYVDVSVFSRRSFYLQEKPFEQPMYSVAFTPEEAITGGVVSEMPK